VVERFRVLTFYRSGILYAGFNGTPYMDALNRRPK
jgi:hypothetical protein